MKPGPTADLRGADAYVRARAWDPSELLHVELVESERGDAAVTG